VETVWEAWLGDWLNLWLVLAVVVAMVCVWLLARREGR